jgi:hypothetical protein
VESAALSVAMTEKTRKPEVSVFMAEHVLGGAETMQTDGSCGNISGCPELEEN